MNTTELREVVESVSFWLATENSEARKELAARRPELAAWLDMIEKRVNEKLKEVEQEEVAAKA